MVGSQRWSFGAISKTLSQQHFCTAAGCQSARTLRIFARMTELASQDFVTAVKIPARTPEVLSPSEICQLGLLWETSKITCSRAHSCEARRAGVAPTRRRSSRTNLSWRRRKQRRLLPRKRKVEGSCSIPSSTHPKRQCCRLNDTRKRERIPPTMTRSRDGTIACQHAAATSKSKIACPCAATDKRIQSAVASLRRTCLFPGQVSVQHTPILPQLRNDICIESNPS